MPIINCHIHTFTFQHVPVGFLPLGLSKILQKKGVRKPLSWALRRALPFSDRDFLDRYMNFMEVTASGKQEDALKRIRSFYPRDTRFVVLPMDMAYMAAGKVKVGLETQLDELLAMYKKLPNNVIPFVAVDPRRPNVLELVKKYVGEHGFKGIKIYPRLGFYPQDERLYPIYEYAQEQNIPVLSHCARGGVFSKEVTDEMLNHPVHGKLPRDKPDPFTHYFTEPGNYRQVLTDFPKLRICLAHFGGNADWDTYLDAAWDPDIPDQKNTSWVGDIVDMMHEFPNLYTDISYTAFSSDRYFPLMSVFMDNHAIRDRIMFGSDYYMIEREKQSEREMCLKIRYALGPERFKRMSEANVEAFLGERPPVVVA